jgi:biofilm protein TabA
MIVDSLGQWGLYFPQNEVWECAFAYLHTLTGSAEPTEMKPVLDDRVLARVMSYQTCSAEDAVLEAHEIYVDIQMSLINGEGIDWFPRSLLTAVTPYDQNSDVLFFKRPDFAPVHIINKPGMFTVLFPSDAHAPQLMAGTEPDLVKKVVVKIKAVELFRK